MQITLNTIYIPELLAEGDSPAVELVRAGFSCFLTKNTVEFGFRLGSIFCRSLMTVGISIKKQNCAIIFKWKKVGLFKLKKIKLISTDFLDSMMKCLML